MSFANKSALVTGGTGAIGGAICEELLKNGVTHLAALDISPKESPVVDQWRKNFPEASIFYYQVDVSSQEELEKCYKEFTKNIKSLDVVVNCAGFLREDDFKKTIDINLCGVMGSTLLAMEYMRKDKDQGQGGIILNVSSLAGLAPYSLMPSYSASKSGIIAFTRSLNHDREYLGIKFLVLCPAGTQSNLYGGLGTGTGFFMATPEKRGQLKAGHPPQSAAVVGEGTIKIMLEGKSGSVWIINQGAITEAPLPAIEF